jgi:predicted enzyme related to lactoylglutathione lyase
MPPAWRTRRWCAFDDPAVSDVDAVTKAAVAAGGRVVMAKSTITGVGDLVFVADPSGNVVGAMRYDENAE